MCTRCNESAGRRTFGEPATPEGGEPLVSLQSSTHTAEGPGVLPPASRSAHAVTASGLALRQTRRCKRDQASSPHGVNSPLTDGSVYATTHGMIIRLREWRMRRGLSLRGLAERSGVHFTTVVRIEAGRLSPTVAMLERLAKALGISVREFFPAEQNPRTTKRRGLK